MNCVEPRPINARLQFNSVKNENGFPEISIYLKFFDFFTKNGIPERLKNETVFLSFLDFFIDTAE